MEERILKWLYDIKDAIMEIESYFNEFPKDFSKYKNNVILKRAIERDLEIIGEAVNRIIQKDPNIAIESAKKIIGLRNQIIHSYDNISDEIIWAVILKYLPKLKTDVLKLISEN